MQTDTYFDEWPTPTGIQWWDDGRKKLNRVIQIVNAWTIAGSPPADKPRILRHIEAGRQTFAQQDGGGGWREELGKMERYVSGR